MSEIAKNDDPLLSKILALAKEQGMNQKSLAQQLHINPVTISEWKKGKSTSYSDVKMIRNIATLLKVDVSELIGGKKAPAPSDGSGQIQPMNEREQELIRIARELDPERQDLLLRIAAAVAYKDVLRNSRVPVAVPGP